MEGLARQIEEQEMIGSPGSIRCTKRHRGDAWHRAVQPPVTFQEPLTLLTCIRQGNKDTALAVLLEKISGWR